MGIQGTNFRPMALCLAAATAAALTGPSASATETTGTANAAVVRPNTLIKTDDLDFGTIVSGATGGTVTVNPATNARGSAGGVTLAGSGAQRAVFQGTTLTRAMTTSGGGIILLGSSATLLPSGVQTYYVGGTLSVPANQPAGDYSGTFTLTVNYL